MFKYTEIRNCLIEDIKLLSVNTKLATRHELCTHFQCTRTTVDRAINDLIKEGLLYARSGSGTYVSERETEKAPKKLIWGIIMPDVMYDLYTSILRGVGDIARQGNVSVQIYNTDNDLEFQHKIVEQLIDSGIDGLIIIPVITKEPKNATFRLLLDKNIPFIFCNRGVDAFPDIPLVCSNGFYGGYLATLHLLENGYRQPAFLSHINYRVSNERLLGYTAAIMENNPNLNRQYIIQQFTGASKLPAYEETLNLLNLPNPPDSIFCAGEMYLQGVYTAIHDAGLRVSYDIGVISHDNSVSCIQQFPNTTAVSFQAYEAGTKAAEILFKLMNGETMHGFNMYVLHPNLVIRESCLGLHYVRSVTDVQGANFRSSL